MKYEKAKAEVVLFDNSDVVTASPLNNPNVNCNSAVFEGNISGDICTGSTQTWEDCRLGTVVQP